MQRLWAPWRMPFIQRIHGRKPKGCIFCKAFSEKHDKANFVLSRGDHSVAMLNIFPYNNGHLMVAPRKHTGDFQKITGAEWQDMMALLGQCQQALGKTLHPHGYNLGINLGRAGGAGIEDHLHMHLVPRWNGDSNFMPVLGATKVLPQSLYESYDQIKRAMTEGRRKEGTHGRKRTARI